MQLDGVGFDNYPVLDETFSDTTLSTDITTLSTQKSSTEEAFNSFIRAVIGDDTTSALSSLEDVLSSGLINETDISGKSALHWAAINGNLILIEKLLKANASVVLQDKWGSTPLASAFDFKKKEAILLLLRDPKSAIALNKKNLLGQTVLHSAIEMGDVDIVLEMLRLMPAKGNIHLNQWRDNFVRTPLALAVIKGQMLMAVNILRKMPIDLEEIKIIKHLLSPGKIPIEDQLSLTIELEKNWLDTPCFQGILHTLFPDIFLNENKQMLYKKLRDDLIASTAEKFSVDSTEIKKHISQDTFEGYIQELRRKQIESYSSAILTRYENFDPNSQKSKISPETLKKVISNACSILTSSQSPQSFLINTANVEVLATWKLKNGKPRLKLLNMTDAKFLGEGTFGTVFKVMKLHKPGQFAALKVAKADAGSSAVRDIVNENGILEKIHSTKNVPGIQLKGTPVKFMQENKEVIGFLCKYYDKGSFDNVLKSDFNDKSNLDWQKALDICGQLIYGAAYLEAHGINHGDIKPANILVRTLSDGNLDCRLSDFGGARSFDTLKENDQWRFYSIGVYTPKYFPSIFRKEIKAAAKIGDWDTFVKLKQKQNVYALGLTLTELFIGNDPDSVSNNIPPEMLQLLIKMVSKDLENCLTAREAFQEMKMILENYHPTVATKYENHLSDIA